MALNGHGWRAALSWAFFSTLILTTSVCSSVSAEDQEEGVTKPAHTPIKCYQCNSWTDEGCSNLKVNGSSEHYLVQCTDDYGGDQPFCRKTVQAIKGHTARVIRSCGWMRHPEDCYHTDDDHHLEIVCQCYTDACNVASRRHGITVLLTAALISYKALV